MSTVVPCYKTPSSLSDNGCRGVFGPLDLPGSVLSVLLCDEDIGRHSSLQSHSVPAQHQELRRPLSCVTQETQSFPAFWDFSKIDFTTDFKGATEKRILHYTSSANCPKLPNQSWLSPPPPPAFCQLEFGFSLPPFIPQRAFSPMSNLSFLQALTPNLHTYIPRCLQIKSLLYKAWEIMNNKSIFSCSIHIKCSQQPFMRGFIIPSLHWGQSRVQTQVLSLQSFVLNFMPFLFPCIIVRCLYNPDIKEWEISQHQNPGSYRYRDGFYNTREEIATELHFCLFVSLF